MKPLPYNITEVDRDFADLIPTAEKQLNIDLKQNLSTQETTLEVFRTSLEHCKFNQFSKSKVVWNAAGYINIISLDLKIISKHLYRSESEWEKRYFARHGALLIHEGVGDLFELFGKSFRAIIDDLPNSMTLTSGRKEITKQLNNYKEEYGARLYELRNASIAHRDTDVLTQIDMICSISWVEAITFISGFDKILNNAGGFMKQLLDKGYFDK